MKELHFINKEIKRFKKLSSCVWWSHPLECPIDGKDCLSPITPPRPTSNNALSCAEWPCGLQKNIYLKAPSQYDYVLCSHWEHSKSAPQSGGQPLEGSSNSLGWRKNDHPWALPRNSSAKPHSNPGKLPGKPFVLNCGRKRFRIWLRVYDSDCFLRTFITPSLRRAVATKLNMAELYCWIAFGYTFYVVDICYTCTHSMYELHKKVKDI